MIAYLNKKSVVCTNDCKKGFGGVLMQEGQVVCYDSQKLNEHKLNYLTHDLELAMIIHALNMCTRYLLGRRTTSMNYHSGLRYMFDQRNRNARQARWLATLSDFDFEIRYIKGKEIWVANALSRMVQVNHIVAISSYGIDLHNIIFLVGQWDEKYIEIMHKLQ